MSHKHEGTGKRKSGKNAAGGLAKSLKDNTPVHESTFLNGDKSAQTSIDWKAAKKRGLASAIQNQAHLGTAGMANVSAQPLVQQPPDKSNKIDFAVLQDNLIVAPKTQSGRPNQKKLATQALGERVSKGSPSTGLGFNGASQNNIKKSAKHSLGLPGRNRTATALLVASASASSEPLQEEDRPSHAIRNFA